MFNSLGNGPHHLRELPLISFSPVSELTFVFIIIIIIFFFAMILLCLIVVRSCASAIREPTAKLFQFHNFDSCGGTRCWSGHPI